MGGAEPQLKLHIPAALECGVDADELVAMCEQITPYAGFPRALNGPRVAGRITRSTRRTRLHPPAGWPWAKALMGAFSRLRALTAFGERL